MSPSMPNTISPNPYKEAGSTPAGHLPELTPDWGNAALLPLTNQAAIPIFSAGGLTIERQTYVLQRRHSPGILPSRYTWWR